MTLKIDTEFRDLIPPMTAEERAGLEESILREGCRDELISWGDTLIDGHNRYEVCQAYGVPFRVKQMDFPDRDAARRWVIQNQLARRNLPAYERARLALMLKPAVQEQAKARQQAGKADLPQNSAEGRGETRNIVAAAAGVSHDTLAKVEKLEQAAPPKLKNQLRSGEVSINRAYQQVLRDEREAAREEKRKQNTRKVEELDSPLEAQGLYQTIVVDPPWDWSDEGDVNQLGRAKPDYHTMPLEELERLPISQIADENCHLYLWVTNRSLPKAFHLMDIWGFRYITCITWVKPSYGMGNYFRGDTEQVLFGVKGSQPLKRHDVGTHFMAPRGKSHSDKPDKFYELVEMCSFGPYIDVFGRDGGQSGRKHRPGWTVWGADAQ